MMRRRRRNGQRSSGCPQILCIANMARERDLSSHLPQLSPTLKYNCTQSCLDHAISVFCLKRKSKILLAGILPIRLIFCDFCLLTAFKWGLKKKQKCPQVIDVMYLCLRDHCIFRRVCCCLLLLVRHQLCLQLLGMKQCNTVLASSSVTKVVTGSGKSFPKSQSVSNSLLAK